MAEPQAEAKTIVVGYDGGEASKDALSLAALLARLTGAQLIAAFAYRGRLTTRQDAERVLHRALRFLPYGQPAGIRAVEGDSPAAVLSELAESTNALLLVAGAAEMDVMRELALTAPCPVAFASRGFAAKGGRTLRKVGVCWEFSPRSEIALQTANELARRAHAQVRLYTASDPSHATDFLPFLVKECAKDDADMLVLGPARDPWTHEQLDVA